MNHFFSFNLNIKSFLFYAYYFFLYFFFHSVNDDLAIDVSKTFLDVPTLCVDVTDNVVLLLSRCPNLRVLRIPEGKGTKLVLKTIQSKNKNIEKFSFPLNDNNVAEFEKSLGALKHLKVLQIQDQRSTPNYQAIIAVIPSDVNNISFLERKWARYEWISFTDGKVNE